MKTVAERAGVSIASVSRVLNGLSARPETVARVEAAVAELRYAPAAAARSLKLGSSGQIACAFADIGNPVYVAMIDAIEREVAGAGLRLVIHSTHSDAEVEEQVVRGLAMGYADGLVISPLRPTDRLVSLLSASTAPVVVIGNISARADVDTVRVDSRLAVRTAISHLAELGRRRIGFLNGPADTSPGRIRLDAFRNARRGAESAKTIDRRFVNAEEFDHDSGLAAARSLLATEELDALLCATDTLAIGAARAISEAGLRIPDDIALASIDDTPLARMCTPQLTSVSLRAAERGAIAAQLLLARLRDPAMPSRKRSLRPELMVRESTLSTSSSNRKQRPSARRRP
ncbi:LacI family DNA-binding transcriptional regulator [Naumannella sp. ID2617S]|nr:LacI family DNA-binding transcriptional regulator [Naumannella sp. ID2617S]